MMRIETFATMDAATERKKELAAKGIASRIMVDPLESIYPALSDVKGVALCVGESEAAAEPARRAS